MVRVIIIAVVLLMLSPGQAKAPEYTEPLKPIEVVEVSLSRGATGPKLEKRTMRITAYANHDDGMNGLGITASGEQTVEGRTIAAPPEIPLYTQIYIPELGQTYTVTDRGGAINGNRLDLYIEDLDRALKFGVRYLEVWVRY